ncbi:MAG: pseudouridine-5'-phosphate glycosidase, partial [Pseudomonadota bacterium]
MTAKIEIAPEVESALKNAEPVVALESTIITHGMPWPDNLAMANEVEAIIRKEGALPATIAVIDGTLHVGLNDEAREKLAKIGNALKLSR